MSEMPRDRERGRLGGMSRRGFTLLEMVLASAILAVIGAAVSAVMMVACRAVPSASGGSATAVELTETIAQMSVDVSLASEFYSTDQFYMAFKGPDADGDGTADEIGYGFNSGEGKLYRSVNWEAAVVAEGIDDCAFTFVTGTEAVRGVNRTVVRSVSVRVEPGAGAPMRGAFACAGLPGAP